MDRHYEERDTLSPKWSCAFFECVSPRKDVQVQMETRTGMYSTIHFCEEYTDKY
jgi:hypothetical protein